MSAFAFMPDDGFPEQPLSSIIGLDRDEFGGLWLSADASGKSTCREEAENRLTFGWKDRDVASSSAEDKADPKLDSKHAISIEARLAEFESRLAALEFKEDHSLPESVNPKFCDSANFVIKSELDTIVTAMENLERAVRTLSNKECDAEQTMSRDLVSIGRNESSHGVNPQLNRSPSEPRAVNSVSGISATVNSLSGINAIAAEPKVASYVLQGCMWDCCIIIGFDCVATVDAVLIVVGTVVNACLQTVLCLTICANLIKQNIDDDTVSAAKRWRADVAHDIKFANAMTKSSLVSQVCAQDEGLHLSAAQFQLADDLNKYLNPNIKLLRHLDGWFLCNCAMLVFFWQILRDLHRNLHLCCAVWSHPRGDPSVTMNKDGHYTIIRFSSSQVVSTTILSVLPRLAVEMMLLISGTALLAYEVSVSELVLNAVALTFILDIDEITFSVLVPLRARSIFKSLHTIRYKPKFTPLVRKFPPLVVMNLFVPFLGLVIVNIFVLLPFRGHAEDVYRWLCHGDQNFVYAINLASGIVYWTNTSSFQPQPLNTYAETAVIALTQIEGDTNHTAKAVKREWSSVEELSVEGIRASSRTLRCIDHLNFSEVTRSYLTGELYYAMLDRMRLLTSNFSLESCSDVPDDFCLQHVHMRAACPETCGCHTPWSGLIFATHLHGCPSACSNQWTDFLYEQTHQSGSKFLIGAAELRFSNKCQNVPTNVLRNLTSWNRYVYGFRYKARSLYGDIGDTMADDILNNGCTAVGFLKKSGFPMCEVGADRVMRSARPWCPRSCDCNWLGTIDKSECPKGCFPEGCYNKQCGWTW